MPRLLSYVLEQMGFPEEPGIEMRDRCPHIVSVDRVMTMPVHFHIRPQDRRGRVRRLRMPLRMHTAMLHLLLRRGTEESHSHFRSFTSISPTHYFSCSPYGYSRAFLFSTPFTGVYTCQLEGDSWSDGCYLHISIHTGSPACSPGAEVDPVLHYASSDHDPLGSSS